MATPPEERVTMRTAAQILKDSLTRNDRLALEVLLDIRALLVKASKTQRKEKGSRKRETSKGG